jgi:hypothetical protein
MANAIGSSELYTVSENHPGEPCLFINGDGIIMFFYVDDIVFAYRTDRKRAAESYIARLKSMFEMRDMGPIKFFLGVRVIQTTGSIYPFADWRH